MKKIVVIAATLFIYINADGQQTSFKFDFGPGKVASGFISIKTNSEYNNKTGYRFEPGAGSWMGTLRYTRKANRVGNSEFKNKRIDLIIDGT